MKGKVKIRQHSITVKQIAGLTAILVFMFIMALYFYFGSVVKISKVDGGFFFRKEYISEKIGDLSPEEEDIGPILPGKDVVQTYTATRDGLIGISLAFQPKGDISRVVVNIKMQEQETGVIIQEWERYASQIFSEQESEYAFFEFSHVIEGVKGKTYDFVISVDNASENNTVTLMKTCSTAYGTLTIGGQETDGNLALYVKGFVGYISKIFWTVWFIFAGIICWLYWKMIIIQKWKIEHVYLVLGIFLVALYCGLFPPYSEPDSEGHVSSVYYQAERFLGKAQLDGEGYLVTSLDEAKRGGLTRKMNLANYNTVKENFFSAQKSDEELGLQERRPLSVPFSAYLPQLIGVVAGQILGMGTIPVLLLGKLVAGLFYLFLCFWAIRMIPFGKMTMLMCSLLPLSLELGTSFSYDSLTIALSFLIISYVLHCVYVKTEIGWKDIAFICVLNIWLAPIKIVYFLVSGLCVLIPISKYRNKIYRILYCGIIMGAGIIAVAVSRMSFVEEVAAGGGASNNYYTWKDILADPVQSFVILLRTIFVDGSGYIQHIFGGIYSWFSLALPWTLVIAFIIVVLLSLLIKDDERLYLDIRAKICMGILIFIMAGSTVMGLWISWTPKDSATIQGIQGRYFMPILPLALLLFRNKMIVLKRKMDDKLVLGFCILQFLTTFMIFTTAIAG